MSEDLIKRSDAIKAVWGEDTNPSEDGMVFEAQSHIDRDIRLIPSEDRPQKVIAKITFDEEKLREIVKEAVERFMVTALVFADKGDDDDWDEE